jgi:hypothetical protein
MKIPMIKTLYVNWGLPLNSKTYKEVGMLMTEILPYVYNVEHADDEGAIIHVLVGENQEEEIKELRNHFLYIDVWFEDEDQEKVKAERIMRWSKKKEVKKNDN